MPRDFHSQSLIDHFLQAEILSKLIAAEHPVKFSELKERGVENSLFMYHANKLIDRGLVQKSEDGFSVTVMGARWANHSGVFHSFAVATPRPLVQFIVRDSQNNILLAVRKGQLRQLLNDYLLPGNIYRHGLSLEDNVALLLRELFGDASVPDASLLTIADIMHRFDDGFVNHVISHIFALNVPGVMPVPESHYLFDIEWVPGDSIVAGNPKYAKSQLLPELFARLPAIQAHESFLITESK